MSAGYGEAPVSTAPAVEHAVRLRQLPGGPVHEGVLTGWNGRYMELDFRGEEFALGEPMEIEHGSMLYWGEVRRREGNLGFLLVEHSLDRARLVADRDEWN